MATICPAVSEAYSIFCHLEVANDCLFTAIGVVFDKEQKDMDIAKVKELFKL